MVNEKSLDLVFHALSDATRRGILREVAKGNPTVADLGKPFPISGPAISKHLKVLEQAGLLERLRDGKASRFCLKTEPINDVASAISELSDLWSRRLDRLEAFLDEKMKWRRFEAE